MGKKKQLANIANEAIEAYMTLIAQVDAMAPMLKAMVDTDNLLEEAIDMSNRVVEVMERDE